MGMYAAFVVLSFQYLFTFLLSKQRGNASLYQQETNFDKAKQPDFVYSLLNCFFLVLDDAQKWVYRTGNCSEIFAALLNAYITYMMFMGLWTSVV